MSVPKSNSLNSINSTGSTSSCPSYYTIIGASNEDVFMFKYSDAFEYQREKNEIKLENQNFVEYIEDLRTLKERALNVNKEYGIRCKDYFQKKAEEFEADLDKSFENNCETKFKCEHESKMRALQLMQTKVECLKNRLLQKKKK